MSRIFVWFNDHTHTWDVGAEHWPGGSWRTAYRSLARGFHTQQVALTEAACWRYVEGTFRRDRTSADETSRQHLTALSAPVV